MKTYAEYKIRSAILDSLRKLDFLPREERKRARWIEAAVSELEQEHQRTPTEAEIATHLGIEVSEYRAWALAACTATCSLDSPGASEDNNPMLHCLAASEDNGPSVPLERAALRKLLAAALRTLPLRERTILRLYYCDKLTMREIGLLIAFSASRVSQLRAKAILRLRTRMDNEWPQRGAAGSTV